MNQDYPIASISEEDLTKIKALENDINISSSEDIILVAYKKNTAN